VEESGRGRGLFSVRERIGLLGGTSGIESKIGAGTTAWAKIPIVQDIRYGENKGTGD
jgi:signal transduction histidine kinase